MVQFNFKPRFEAPIRAGTKQQTIRNLRKRDARPDDGLQLQGGSRFKPVRWGLASCLDAGMISMDFTKDTVAIEWLREGPRYIFGSTLDQFAVMDGFLDWHDLRDFWDGTHGRPETFDGWITFWGETFEPAGT